MAAAVLAPQQAPTPWQQGVSYRIEARLDEEAEVLSARARVWYRNESPDTLRDFYFQLHLNAFRPNSAWARRDLEHGIRTFQDLGPEQHGFERVERMVVDGRAVEVAYPRAPDSTVARIELPVPLPPGGEITLEYDWRARPSVVPRRQGRAGRHWDFAQWYPRVAVYDLEGWRDHPLYRQGEFYGEFATYDVTLDVAQDQVIGSTGVPVEGDPGWAAVAVSGTGPIDYQRDWYGSTSGPPCVVRGGVRTCGIPAERDLEPGAALGLLPELAASGRKHVRWRAEDVHHFAWSTSPDYIYEQGSWNDVAIRVLYRPGDHEEWGNGVAVRRTAVALQWLATVFGDYPYPQVTNLHRLEGGGTEFPMVVMNGGASQGLILHEVGHIYVHGILANNEWYEGWLDEGFTSFVTAWFSEEQGTGRAQWLGSEMRVLDFDLRGVSEPVTLQAERYAEMGVYSTMIYTKGSLVFWMLREMVGKQKMLEITRTFFDRYRFRHVDQHAFQSVAEEVTGRDLDGFFGQWLHAGGVVDYELEGVESDREGDGWVTRVRMARNGDLRMPVRIRLRAGEEIRDTVVPGDALRATHRVRTSFEPDRVVLDPELVTMDWNALNNSWPNGWLDGSVYTAHFDNPVGTLPVYRDRAALGFFPLAWFNDAGGIVGGLQARSSYMGDIRRVLVRLGLPGVEAAGVGDTSDAIDPGSLYFRVENPIVFDRPRFGTSLEAFGGEGRALLRLAGERDVSRLPLSGPRRTVRAWVDVGAVYDDAYVVPGRWSPESHVTTELGLGFGRSGRAWTTDLGVSAGASTDDKLFGRAIFTSEVSAATRGGWRAGLRLFAGGTMANEDGQWGGERTPRERQVFVAGGDPHDALSDPWIRSAGALLDEEGWTTGGGRLLGYHPGLAFAQLVTLTAEALSSPLTVGSGRTRLEARARLFGGAGLGSEPSAVDAPAVLTPGVLDGLEGWRHVYASAGAGVELGFGGSPVRLRLDLPLLVFDPEVASRGRDARVAFRYAVRLVGYP